MPNWFYLDANGQQQGPVSDSQLKTLATQGIIQPDTPLATDTGKKGTAGQIRGLFPAAAAPATTPAENDPWDWGGLPANEVSSLVNQSQTPGTPQYQPPKTRAC